MDEIDNGLKLVMNYSIKPSAGQAYYDYVLGHYIPRMQSMGLEVAEAWHTAYGDYPERLIVFVSRDQESVRRLMYDQDWEELNERLLQFVSDFEYKIIPYKIGFQF
jgi:hypothetical protein